MTYSTIPWPRDGSHRDVRGFSNNFVILSIFMLLKTSLVICLFHIAFWGFSFASSITARRDWLSPCSAGKWTHTFNFIACFPDWCLAYTWAIQFHTMIKYDKNHRTCDEACSTAQGYSVGRTTRRPLAMSPPEPKKKLRKGRSWQSLFWINILTFLGISSFCCCCCCSVFFWCLGLPPADEFIVEAFGHRNRLH